MMCLLKVRFLLKIILRFLIVFEGLRFLFKSVRWNFGIFVVICLFLYMINLVLLGFKSRLFLKY